MVTSYSGCFQFFSSSLWLYSKPLLPLSTIVIPKNQTSSSTAFVRDRSLPGFLISGEYSFAMSEKLTFKERSCKARAIGFYKKMSMTPSRLMKFGLQHLPIRLWQMVFRKPNIRHKDEYWAPNPASPLLVNLYFTAIPATYHVFRIVACELLYVRKTQ